MFDETVISIFITVARVVLDAIEKSWANHSPAPTSFGKLVKLSITSVLFNN